MSDISLSHGLPSPFIIPGFPVLHYLLEFAQTCVHWVGDATQPSHLLPPPSPLTLNLSQHQGLFQWVGSLYQVAKVFEIQLLASVFPVNIHCWFPLGLTGLISLLSKGLSRVFSSTTVWKHQCFGTQPFMVLLSHMYMTTGKTIALTKNVVFAITQMSVHIAALPAVT